MEKANPDTTQIISWRCIPHTSKLSRRDVFSTQGSYLEEMYSAHKQTISWRCIHHTGYLMEMYSANRPTTSQRRLFNAEYLMDIYTLHIIYRTNDVFSTAGYFAQWMYSTMQDILLSGCIQQCRIFCSVDVFNNAGYFAPWMYSTHNISY